MWCIVLKCRFPEPLVLLCELNYAEGKAVIDAKVDLVDPEVTWYIRKNRDISRSHADLDKDYDFVEAGSQDHSNDRFDDYESPKGKRSDIIHVSMILSVVFITQNSISHHPTYCASLTNEE